MTELARLQLAPHELMRVAAIMAVGLVVVLSEAAFSGSMAFFLIVLALWLAIRVYQNPEEAIQAGILFMIACNVLLPASNRFDWTFPASELYYWATGILIITIAAVARIGIRSLLRIPASVKVFVLVAAVAAFVGFAKGNAPSYVIRQFYGSLLLVLYFAIASRVGDERLFLHRLRTYGLLCAAGFFVYYAAVFGEYGFHKEVTSLGMQVGTVAVLCLLTGISENCASWIASGFVLLGVPLLLFSRHPVLTFVFAAALVLGVKASTKKSKLLFYAAAALVWMPSVFPEGAEIILDKAMDSPAIEKMLPPGARDVTSLVDRNLELMAGLDVLRSSPLLGDGLGGELGWDSPGRGWFSQAFVDNGWAYVAVKFGGAGIVAFGWFIVTVLRCVSRRRLVLSVCLLSLLFVANFSAPVFFQFTMSPMTGAVCGLLYAKKIREAETPDVYGRK